MVSSGSRVQARVSARALLVHVAVASLSALAAACGSSARSDGSPGGTGGAGAGSGGAIDGGGMSANAGRGGAAGRGSGGGETGGIAGGGKAGGSSAGDAGGGGMPSAGAGGSGSGESGESGASGNGGSSTPPDGYFACLDLFCDSATEYCDMHRHYGSSSFPVPCEAGESWTSASCHPLPTACDPDPSCSCVMAEPFAPGVDWSCNPACADTNGIVRNCMSGCYG